MDSQQTSESTDFPKDATDSEPKAPRKRIVLQRPTKEQDEYIRRELKKLSSEYITLMQLMVRFESELRGAKTQANWDTIAGIFNRILETDLTGDSVQRAYGQLLRDRKGQSQE